MQLLREEQALSVREREALLDAIEDARRAEEAEAEQLERRQRAQVKELDMQVGGSSAVLDGVCLRLFSWVPFSYFLFFVPRLALSFFPVHSGGSVRSARQRNDATSSSARRKQGRFWMMASIMTRVRPDPNRHFFVSHPQRS